MSEFKFTMGADPEFNFISPQTGRGDAQQAMRAFFPKNPNWESANAGFKIKGKNHGSIGWDGCSSTGEVRPAPVKTPKAMVENLMALFQETAKSIPLLEMSTLSFYAPVGGHIHFGLDPAIRAKQGAIVAIHKKLSSFYLPIMLSENKLSLQIRVRGNYGKITDHHKDNSFTMPDGSTAYTYEFRTPSAEWLTTPKITEATLAYLGCVYNEILYQPKNFKKCSDIVYKTDKQGDALQMLAMTDYETLSLLIFDKIKKYVKTFELYPKYKKEIDYILTPAKVLADKKAVQYNINKGWGLETTKEKLTKKDLLSEKKYKTKLKDVDLDTVSNLTRVIFNNDTNVEIFAKELSNRCAVFNWKLKYNYFLYGLRKGIPDFIVSNSGFEMYRGQKMIKTTGDLEAISNLIRRMKDRVAGNFQTGGNPQIDFNTGEVCPADKKNVMIGIPYDLRVEKKTDKLIEIIHDIESGALTNPKFIKELQVKNTMNGKIVEIFNQKTKQEQAPETIEIRSDQAQRLRQVVADNTIAEGIMDGPMEITVDEVNRMSPQEHERIVREFRLMEDGNGGPRWTRIINQLS